MKHYLEQIVKDLVTKNIERYWGNFEIVAYALFDKTNVYLFNHPEFDNPHSYKILKWNEQFVGTSIILYEGFPTAIVDLEMYKDYEGLYSILVHELFHGYQYIKGEKRFPDEIMGGTYPLIKENAELRCRERKTLYNALFETNISKKKQCLSDFITIREKRAEVIEEHLIYENLVETVEGPAWYVEIKAYLEKSPLDNDLILNNYGNHLIDTVASTSNIRRSCYSSGLVMCLLLDEFSPNWKESFFDTDATIYDLIKDLNIAPRNFQIENVEIRPETEEAFNFAVESRKEEIEEFEEQSGTRLVIEGEITSLLLTQ
jgi:hypothetical protein